MEDSIPNDKRDAATHRAEHPIREIRSQDNGTSTNPCREARRKEADGLRRKPMPGADCLPPSGGSGKSNWAWEGDLPRGQTPRASARWPWRNRKIPPPFARPMDIAIGNAKGSIPQRMRRQSRPPVKLKIGIANASVSRKRRIRERLGIHNQVGAKRGPARGKPLERPRT